MSKAVVEFRVRVGVDVWEKVQHQEHQDVDDQRVVVVGGLPYRIESQLVDIIASLLLLPRCDLRGKFPCQS